MDILIFILYLFWRYFRLIGNYVLRYELSINTQSILPVIQDGLLSGIFQTFQINRIVYSAIQRYLKDNGTILNFWKTNFKCIVYVFFWPSFLNLYKNIFSMKSYPYSKRSIFWTKLCLCPWQEHTWFVGRGRSDYASLYWIVIKMEEIKWRWRWIWSVQMKNNYFYFVFKLFEF